MPQHETTAEPITIETRNTLIGLRERLAVIGSPHGEQFNYAYSGIQRALEQIDMLLNQGAENDRP